MKLKTILKPLKTMEEAKLAEFLIVPPLSFLPVPQFQAESPQSHLRQVVWVCGCDGMGLGNERNGAIVPFALLVVSDKKPTETVSSKIKSVLAPNQASQNEWNWVQHG